MYATAHAISPNTRKLEFVEHVEKFGLFIIVLTRRLRALAGRAKQLQSSCRRSMKMLAESVVSVDFDR